MLWLGSWKRRSSLLIAVVAVALAVLAGAIDFAATSAKVPALPPRCTADSPAGCQSRSVDGFQARLDRAGELEDGLATRATIYLVVGLLAVAFAVIRELQVRSPSDRGPVMTDLGVAGTLVLIATAILLLVASGSFLSAPTGPAWALGVTMVLAAFIGSVSLAAAGGLTSAEEASASGRPRSLADFWRVTPWYALLTLGLLATAFVLYLVYAGRVPECGEASGDPSVTYGWLVLIASGATMLSALICLVRRAWVFALIGLVGGVAVLLLGALTGLC